MQTQDKIEFYKKRTLGERFSAASDFVRQNWKILWKNVAYIGIPLAILQGYFMQNYMQNIFSIMIERNFEDVNWFSLVMLFVVSSVLILFLFSMTGSILYNYNKGNLDENSGWNELQGDMFSILGKYILQGLIVCGITFVVVLVFGLLIGGLAFTGGGMASGIVGIIFVLLLYAVLFALMPPLALMLYPVIFEKESPWKAIVKGFRLGFKNWGSVFLTVFLASLLAGMVTNVISMPYFINLMFNMTEGGEGGILDYILAAFTSAGYVIIYPVSIIFIGFQYTSIVEKEEGISLQNKIDDFEEL